MKINIWTLPCDRPPTELRTIRNQLPDLIAARCSPASYTRAVERAYRTMWEKYCANDRVKKRAGDKSRGAPGN